MKKKVILAMAVLVLSIVVALIDYHNERIQPVFINNELNFKIDYGSTNGLLRLVISDSSTGKDVWNVKLAYFYGKYLKYDQGFVDNVNELLADAPIIEVRSMSEQMGFE